MRAMTNILSTIILMFAVGVAGAQQSGVELPPGSLGKQPFSGGLMSPGYSAASPKNSVSSSAG